MDSCYDILKKFINQSKEWSDLNLKISFGMGMPARIPWTAFITEEMSVSEGSIFRTNNIGFRIAIKL